MKTTLLLSITAFVVAFAWRTIQMFGAGGVIGSFGVALLASVYAWNRALYRAYAQRLVSRASIVGLR